MDFLSQFKAARRASVPLVAVSTPDPAATILGISNLYKENGTPVLSWDIVSGLSGVNALGKEAVSSVTDKPNMLTNPVQMLASSVKMPKKSILFFFTAERFFQEPSIVQAIWNLRDKFKAETQTLVMLASSFKLPASLSNDVLVLDEPLPTTEQLEEIVKDSYAAAELKPSKDNISRAVDAICGLAAFPAEQACFMSMEKDGLDFDYLWERKRQAISQTNGLSVWRGGERFSDIGGCDNVKNFFKGILDKYRAIVFIDEIEKAVAGAGGDTSGTSQEMVGTLLTFMQDKNADGVIEIGVPGGAKSAIAKAAGNEGGIPTIVLDFSGMKASLVGESGANLRNGLKVIEAVSQGRALFIATCNSIEALSAELRRRFTLGTFFFDLPSEEERELIWKLYLSKFGISQKDSRPRDDGWTGAEIRTCCKLASQMRRTLKEAAAYIVPVSKSAGDRISSLRSQANGRFISASYEGFYESERKEQTSRRKLATV